MQAKQFNLIRYDADEGKVFDWKEARFVDEVQEHLYVKTLFIGANDNIENYVEVEAPTEGAAE